MGLILNSGILPLLPLRYISQQMGLSPLQHAKADCRPHIRILASFFKQSELILGLLGTILFCFKEYFPVNLDTLHYTTCSLFENVRACIHRLGKLKVFSQTYSFQQTPLISGCGLTKTCLLPNWFRKSHLVRLQVLTNI